MAVMGISCDRCGSTITENRTLLHTITGPLRIHRPAIDLCLTCASDLAKFLAECPARPAIDLAVKNGT
jgi:hypothetical protein